MRVQSSFVLPNIPLTRFYQLNMVLEFVESLKSKLADMDEKLDALGSAQEHVALLDLIGVDVFDAWRHDVAPADWAAHVLRALVTSSALDPSSFSRLADICDDFLERADESGLLQRHRSAQAADSIWEHAHAELADALRASPAAQRAVADLAAEVGAGALSAGAAGERIAAQALRGIDGADAA